MKTDDVCEVNCIHEKSVKEVKSKMLEEKTFKKISEDFKILADPTRVKLLYALFQMELCVCDIACIVGMTDSAVSHQFRLLRGRGMVKFRKAGKMAYYSLADEHVIQLIKMETKHVEE